jgi:hypothetical protein
MQWFRLNANRYAETDSEVIHSDKTQGHAQMIRGDSRVSRNVYSEVKLNVPYEVFIYGFRKYLLRNGNTAFEKLPCQKT